MGRKPITRDGIKEEFFWMLYRSCMEPNEAQADKVSRELAEYIERLFQSVGLDLPITFSGDSVTITPDSTNISISETESKP